MTDEHDYKFMWDGSSGEVYALDMLQGEPDEDIDNVIPWRPVAEVVVEDNQE